MDDYLGLILLGVTIGIGLTIVIFGIIGEFNNIDAKNLLESDYVVISNYDVEFNGLTGIITNVSGDVCSVKFDDGCGCKKDIILGCEYVKRIKGSGE